MPLLPHPIRVLLARRQMRRFYRAFIQPGQLCLDIGANHGHRSAAFLDIGARCIALEPQEQLHQHLLRRFRGNPRFSAICAGVGQHEGTLLLHTCAETDECTTFSQEFIQTFTTHSQLHFQPAQEVPVTTLAALRKQHGHARFIKVDTEGHELPVILGMDIPPDYLAFEFNQPLIHQTKACVEALSSHAQARFNLIPYASMRLMWPQWITAAQLLDEWEAWIQPGLATGEIVVRFSRA